ncbi:MAG: dihydrofolate reductase family protein [Bauldia sp.]|nr:dihydrofolate reductase family protein [Bauldia sp.]
MRKVTAGLFISIDGVTQSPDKWQFDFDEVMGEALTAAMNAQDAFLIGRTTYEEWSTYWPNATTDLDFARHINEKPKYVVSSKLARTDWQNSILLKGSLANEVPKLKRMEGKDIGVAGSPSLVRSLIELDLLDELQLVTIPVIAGSGRKLFTGGEAFKRMSLAGVTKTPTGTVILTYQRKR